MPCTAQPPALLPCMTITEALVLGIIQGIFMFLPVSSTSHLVLMQHWLIRHGSSLPAPDCPEMILFDLVVHVGTLVSIAIVFRRSLQTLLRNLGRDLSLFVRRKNGFGELLYLRLGALGLLAVVITGALGLPLKATFEQAFAQPIILSATLTITGLLLYSTDRVGPRKKGLRNITPKVAAAIGAAQGLALLPGISRSGTTIAFALLSGLKRRWAAEFSFFIAFPTILAAAVFQASQVQNMGGAINVGLVELAVGFVVAALVGIGALHLVLKLLYRARFRFFSYYVWTLAVVVLFCTLYGIF